MFFFPFSFWLYILKYITCSLRFDGRQFTLSYYFSHFIYTTKFKIKWIKFITPVSGLHVFFFMVHFIGFFCPYLKLCQDIQNSQASYTIRYIYHRLYYTNSHFYTFKPSILQQTQYTCFFFFFFCKYRQEKVREGCE